MSAYLSPFHQSGAKDVIKDLPKDEQYTPPEPPEEGELPDPINWDMFKDITNYNEYRKVRNRQIKIESAALKTIITQIVDINNQINKLLPRLSKSFSRYIIESGIKITTGNDYVDELMPFIGMHKRGKRLLQTDWRSEGANEEDVAMAAVFIAEVVSLGFALFAGGISGLALWIVYDTMAILGIEAILNPKGLLHLYNPQLKRAEQLQIGSESSTLDLAPDWLINLSKKIKQKAMTSVR